MDNESEKMCLGWNGEPFTPEQQRKNYYMLASTVAYYFEVPQKCARLAIHKRKRIAKKNVNRIIRRAKIYNKRAKVSK